MAPVDSDLHAVRIDVATLRQEDPDTWANWRRSRRFWGGVAIGFVLACGFDLTDLHICTGECDGAGYDIMGERK